MTSLLMKPHKDQIAPVPMDDSIRQSRLPSKMPVPAIQKESASRLLQASRIALQNTDNGNQRNDVGPAPREASRLRPPAT
ncbi:hypothetical protein AAVH_06719, partial [Aphelenchoides avenae]